MPILKAPDLKAVLNRSTKCVCPFRSEVRVFQTFDENNLPIQNQITLFPECQYEDCPFYNPEATSNNERCSKASGF